MHVYAGQSVVVRTAVEILATLDAKGAHEGVAFMPEMAAMIGKTYRVHRRAERICVEGHGFRRLADTVFLDEARCDGSAHDGCQRGCLMFWHEAWLRPADATERAVDGATEARARRALKHLATRTGDQYSCQSTHLAAASQPLPGANVKALLRDVKNGDITAAGLAGIILRAAVNRARAMVGLPQMGMILGQSGKKSRGDLDLRPGEWVRIRDEAWIRSTLGPDGKNLGLSFEPEMARLIGEVRQVDHVVERMIHEETGRMVKLTRTVILKDTWCRGLCSKLCPRANPLFWREVWLERVDAPVNQVGMAV